MTGKQCDYHLVLLTSKLEIVVVGADSKEAARAADLLIRGEDKEKSDAGEPKRLIGSWLIYVPTREIIESYGFRCRGVDPEEYGYSVDIELNGYVGDSQPGDSQATV